jgi:uncharacterized damage-inducible protein DinB
MMNYARYITLDTIEGLNRNELDHLIDGESNSIGALLMHMAAVEYDYQTIIFEKRDLTEEESDKWKAGLELGEIGRSEIKGNDLEYYIKILDDIRKRTLGHLKEKNDEWLYEEFAFWGGAPSNNYFIWFHVFEDEINHRGQISWIKKRLKNLLL